MSKPSVHFIGIGGTGLSAIARLLLESGYRVTGSDRQLSPLAASLQEAGVVIFIGHRAENVLHAPMERAAPGMPGADLVVRSSAVPDDNVEVQAARSQGIPVLKRSEFLGQLMAGHLGIAVAGSHGKTTTTAMLAWMLTALGQDPSYIIGGVSANLGANAHAGRGQAFVIEADEYDRMFLGLNPKLAVVTNVEHDHPDCFPTAEDFYQAFVAFTAGLQPGGCLLACADDPGSARLATETRLRGQVALTYGLHRKTAQPQASAAGQSLDYQAENLTHNQHGAYTFDACCSLTDGGRFNGFELRPAVTLQVPGEHNVRNALAALAVAHQLGLPLAEAGQALGAYRGTGRRFEMRGEVGGVAVIDDYAHHPTEIRAAIEAARTRYVGRSLWVVWQPHTYSRTRTLFEAFTQAFGQADHVLVTEIYASREALPADGFSANQVVNAMKHEDKHFIPDLAQVTTFLLGRLKAGDVLLVLSAGDADQISTQVLAALQERSYPHD